MPTNTKHHDPHIAGLYQAMALRFYAHFVDMRHSAEHRGEDLPDYGPLPSELEADERYEAAVIEWLREPPDSAGAALALVEFAGILAVDRLMGELLRDPVNDPRDAYHQTIALTAASQWLNKLDMEDFFERERTKDPDVNTMLETLQRHGADAELFALIAEYRRQEHELNARKEGRSDEEIERLSAELRTLLDKLDKDAPPHVTRRARRARSSSFDRRSGLAAR